MNNTMLSKLRLCRIAIMLVTLLFSAAPATSQVNGEYFWNSDPGVGKAGKMTDSGEADGYHSFTIDAQGLRPGMNMLGFRAFSGGRWTQTLYSFVMVDADPKAAAWSCEYFWDTDPGIGKASFISEGSFAGGVLTAAMPADGLGSGPHTLGLRVKCGDAWSQTNTYLVAVPAEPQAADWKAEYFWDTDPGIGKGTPLTAQLGAEGGVIDVDVLTEGLAAGQHTIGFRTYSGSAWSPTVTALVTIPDGRSTEITGAEYFWGADPGFGNGTPIAVESGNDVSVELKDIDFPLDVAEEYVLSFRARSAQGWGTTVTRVIPHLYVESVDLTSESALLPAGETMKIEASVTPADAFDPGLTWTSSDTAVATVGDDGTVTGIAPGSVTVTATSTDGSEVSGSIELTVLVPVRTITLSESELTLEVGKSAAIEATFSPSDATDTAVVWTVEGGNCVTVDANGTVTAIETGEATVIATAADDFGARAECHVKVVPLRGDADGSGSLAVNDVVLTARGVVGDIDEKLIFEAVDLNGDDILTVGDLTGVVGEVLAYEAPDTKTAHILTAGNKDIRNGYITLDASGMDVLVLPESYSDYCGLQFDIVVSSGLKVAGIKSDGHSAALAHRDTSTRVLSYSTEPYDSADGVAARISLEAMPGARSGEYDVTLTNVMASDINGNLYDLGDCCITILYEPTSGIRATSDDRLKISVEGHRITVESPSETVVALTDMTGISRRIRINSGTNTLTVDNPGVYFINDRKIIIR